MFNNKEDLQKLKDCLLSKNRQGRIRDLLTKIVIDEINISDSSSEYDRYEKLIDDNLISIRNILNNLDVLGVNIEFKSDDYIEILVDNNITKIKRNFNKIDGPKFEILCKDVLSFYIKGSLDIVPKHSREDTLTTDIVGEINIIDEISVKTQIYGQIKNQGSFVTLNQLKQFIGGIKALLSEKSKEKGYMHSYILIYITSSEFHREAITYMKDIGVISIDGYQLASLINNNNNIDLNKYIVIEKAE